MASIKIVMRKDKKNSRGESPLYLRIIRKRKTSFISLGLYLLEKHWDSAGSKVKTTYKNSGRLNSFLLDKLNETMATIVDEEKKNRNISSQKLKEQILGGESVDFFVYSQQYIQALESGKQIGTLGRANAVIEKLKFYCEDKPLYLNDITYKFLMDYEEYLRTKMGNKVNTIHANMRIIRKIINDAILEDKMSRDDNPFNKYRLKSEPTNRHYLTEEEMKVIETLDLSKNNSLKMARDVFIFACYAGGIRVSDVLLLRWKQISEGRINIQMRKTGEQIVFKLPDRALEILDSFKPEKENPEALIFPYMNIDIEGADEEQIHFEIKRKTSLINKYLKELAAKAKIDKKLSFHVSRHTFATVALKKGMRMEYVSKVLGHADLAETQIYAKIINEELDSAMEVFNKK